MEAGIAVSIGLVASKATHVKNKYAKQRGGPFS